VRGAKSKDFTQRVQRKGEAKSEKDRVTEETQRAQRKPKTTAARFDGAEPAATKSKAT